MNYPALEEIYDLATDDLKELQQNLQANPQGHQQLLETIKLEIQERKTLQFFAKLCQTDNPYAKKITDFNTQFIRLAEQAINNKHNQPAFQPIQKQQHRNYEKYEKQLSKNKHTQQQTLPKHKQLIPYCLNQQHDANYNKLNVHKETETDTRSIQSQTITNKNNDNVSVTTLRSTSKDSQNTEKLSRSTMKMGIGFNKSKKNKMADIIKNTLARTKVQTVITIKRSSAQSPKKNNYDKKYHIPGQKHENVELKKKASPPLNPVVQQKKMDPKKKQDAAAIKSAKQITNRTKSQAHKSGTVKLPKINAYKDLVEMVKKEEEQKRNKTEKNIQSNNSIEKEEKVIIKNKEKTKGDENSAQDKAKQDENEEKIEQEIEVNYQSRESRQSSQQMQQEIQQEINVDVQIIKQQQFQESMSPEKIQKIMQQNITKKSDKHDLINEKKAFKHEVINNQHEKTHDKSKQIEANKIQTLKRQQTQKQVIFHKQQQQIQNAIHMQNNKQNKNIEKSSQKQIISVNQKQQQQKLAQKQNKIIKSDNKNDIEKEPIDYTKKLLQQIDHDQQYYFFDKAKQAEIDNNTIELDQDQNEQQDNDDKDCYQPRNKQSQRDSQENKKIYSEEYWQHIRQEAQLKIKRFRQQKQIQKLTQFQHIRPKSNKLQNQEQEQQNQKQDVQQTKQAEQQMKSTAQKFNAEIQKKKAELQKLKKRVMKNNQKKIIKPNIPKIIHPKPEFNYLDIYPTFNHIFSVMYLKPAHQANQDIPNLMRQMKTLFTNHLQHFNQNKTAFQPALFLPFDHHGSFQIKDPKQLLMHAQNTYIDLKLMVQRIQYFNRNLQGSFQDNINQRRYFRVVKSKQEVYDIITTSFLRKIGWKQLPHGSGLRTSWNLFWSWSKPDIDMNKLLVWQRVNHFPFNKNLSRKDLLYKNLEHFKKAYRIPINFLPLTFNLPKQFSQLSIKFHEEQVLNKDKNYWIMKPIGKSRGRGIKVISALSQLNYIDNIVVQKYIANPLLLDGYKFDLRIYVLVTSFHPLEAFVYKQGFARLSTEKFNLNANSIKNTFIHLTNFSINKNNLQANTNFSGGSKISLKTLKDKLTRMGYSYNKIWNQIHEIIIKSLLGCSVSVPSFPTAFELFGYDVMIDSDGHCDLIEINASPSLERSFIIDEIIKQNLIDDIFDIVNPPDFDKKELVDVLTERIQMITDKKKITAEDDLIGLARILKYKPIRKVGEKPQKMGLFQMVAPSQASLEIQKLIKSKSGANNPLNID